MYFIFLLLLLLLVLIRINNVGVKICLNRFFLIFVNRGICVVSRACAGKVPSPPSTTQAGGSNSISSSSSNNDSGSGGGCIISNSDNDDDDDDVPRDWESLHNSHWLPRASASSRIGPSNAAASASAAFARRNALVATPTPSTSSSSAVNADAAASAVEEEEEKDEDEDHLRPGPSRWIGYYDAASLYPSSGTCSPFIHSFVPHIFSVDATLSTRARPPPPRGRGFRPAVRASHGPEFLQPAILGSSSSSSSTKLYFYKTFQSWPRCRSVPASAFTCSIRPSELVWTPLGM